MEDVEVRRVRRRDDEEEWARVTEDHILHVTALYTSNDEWPWNITVAVAEFIRTQPLQSELFDAITSALSGVRGVTRAVQEDREVWLVQGSVTGDTLVRACSVALDRIAESLRKAYAAS